MSVETRIGASQSGTEAKLKEPHGKAADPAWAWAEYKPDARRPWDLSRAGHLYRRAAFGARWSQLEGALAEGPRKTIDRLLAPDADWAAFDRTYDEYEAYASAAELRAWWLRRMMLTPHPFQEKMALFWHGHFATSGVKVADAALMRQHVQLLRSHALGRFAPLLEAISSDPAVLTWLGAGANRKARPSDGFARQLMDRFGVGPGYYSEKDVSEAARAFTGWFVLRGQSRFIAREHDSLGKEILGQQGKFNGKDVVGIVLQQPATSRLLVRKLYRWLISETHEPSDKLIEPLADSFAKGYDVGKLVGRMLRSNLFFSPAAYRQRIKSPVEFALGIVGPLEGSVSTTQLGQDLAWLGQNLGHPPTVKGWEGGRYWINNATLTRRSNLALVLVGGSKKPYGDKLDPLEVASRHGHRTAESAARFLLDLFLQTDIEAHVEKALLEIVRRPAAAVADSPSRLLRQFVHAVVTLPEFQLA